jgi:thiazole/oxazole-forming peptide maturase SagC family component
MNYFLHPGLTVTEVSSEKMHLTNHVHQITIEGQNQNLKLVLQAIQAGQLAALLQQQDADTETLHAIVEFLAEHQFTSREAVTTQDRMMLDLALMQSSQQDDVLENSVAQYENLLANSVALFGQGELFNRVATELRALNFAVLENPAEQDCGRRFLLSCSDHPNFNLDKKINALALQQQLPALFGSLHEHVAYIGPLLFPGESSCFSCYEHRIAPNLQFIEETQASQQQYGNVVKASGSPRLYAIAASFQLISQVLKFYNRAYALCLVNEVLEIDLIDYAAEIRPVLRIPHCPACYGHTSQQPKAAVRALL